MNELDTKEKDLLERVRTKPELRTLFFRKVKGLRWFNALHAAGYFNPENMPRPAPAREEGYVTIARWEIAEYLARTVPELVGHLGAEYAPRLLEIIRNATFYAAEQGFSNYQTWWKFSEAISQLPSEFVPTEFIDVVDYWLDDKYDRTLVSEQIGQKWLLKLLDEGGSHSFDLATKLLEVLYKLVVIEQDSGERKKTEVTLRFDSYRAKQITKSVAQVAGRRLGIRAVRLFQSKLEQALKATSIDTWSSVWHPAIEEHPQNEHRDKPENTLIDGYRECLTGYLRAFSEEARGYVGELLVSDFQTVQRVAIFGITEHYSTCNVHVDRLLNERFLHSNFRHEYWHFMNRTYALLKQDQKDKLLSMVGQRSRVNDKGELLEGATAYEHAIWLAAVKDFGDKEARLYKEAVATAKAEPEHPDFSSYMSVGWVGPQSPYSVEELSALSISELSAKLASYKDRDGWRQPGIEGLCNVLKALLKATPARYYPDILMFSELDHVYVYSVIDAYSELWREKVSLPWNDIWPALLNFCSVVTRAERFWKTDSDNEREDFVANRSSIVRAIGRLLESGTKSDEHALDEKYHGDVEALIVLLLAGQKGEAFRADSDAVSIAINSPRGACIEALLNLTLRSCRLADRQNNKNHSDTWKHFQGQYDTELQRAEIHEHEFSTLVTNYLPNFLYLSNDWVHANLGRIFNAENYLQWLCAVQGYSYVGTVYKEVYAFLKDQGHLLRILDDVNIKKKVSDKVVQNIVVAYLNDFESLTSGDSLIRALIQRQDNEELSQLIWFVWTLHKDGDVKQKSKVHELWPALMTTVDTSTKTGRLLASSLCHWSVFVDELDSERKALLLAIAPYAEYSHNSYILLQSLARNSETKPFDANEILLKMLEEFTPSYPEEAVRTVLANLVARGEEGKRAARITVSEYLKRGVEKPSQMLKEILKSQKVAET